MSETELRNKILTKLRDELVEWYKKELGLAHKVSDEGEKQSRLNVLASFAVRFL